MFDVIVIGGGIVGAATAYHLVHAGARALLVDRRDRGRATDAGAGILSAETYSGDSEAWFELALEAAAYYPKLVSSLAPYAQGDLGYSSCPKITVALEEDELPAFERISQHVRERQRRGSGPPAEALYELTSAQVRGVFPALAPVRAGLYFANSARVDGRQLTAALLRAARDHGLDELNAEVDELVLRGSTVAGVRAQRTAIAGAAVVIAGGAWSAAFERQLGLRCAVEPQRGQLVHLLVRDLDTSAWPIVEAVDGHYLVPWAGGRVVAGATRETGAGFRASATAAGIDEVLRAAFRLLPILRQAEVSDIRVGLRPLSADRLPLLGPIKRFDRLFVATGHGSTGLQLGPYSGKLVAEAVLGEPSRDLAPFSIERFSTV